MDRDERTAATAPGSSPGAIRRARLEPDRRRFAPLLSGPPRQAQALCQTRGGPAGRFCGSFAMRRFAFRAGSASLTGAEKWALLPCPRASAAGEGEKPLTKGGVRRAGPRRAGGREASRMLKRPSVRARLERFVSSDRPRDREMTLGWSSLPKSSGSAVSALPSTRQDASSAPDEEATC